MNAIAEFLNAYLTAGNVVLAACYVGVFAFSVLAGRAQARLWEKTRQGTCRRQQQQFITEARGRLR